MKSECVINHRGTKKWYVNGKIHREDGPAVECSNGDKYWYQNDKLHREYGPAIEYANGNKIWYSNDRFHREDGPACEWFDGGKDWFINGECITFKQWLEHVWDTLSIEQQEKYIFNGFEDAE